MTKKDIYPQILSKSDEELWTPAVLNSIYQKKEEPSIERKAVINNNPGHSSADEWARRNFAPAAEKHP